MNFKKTIIISLLLLVLYFSLKYKKYDVEWFSKELVKNNNKFYVRASYQINKKGERIKPNKTFIILKYNKLKRRGGIFNSFIRKQYLGHNNVHVISILDKKIDDNLVGNIHSVISDLGLNKYSLVYGKIDESIIKQYIEKYGNEVENITHITGHYKIF